MKRFLTLALLLILSLTSFAQITVDTTTTNKMSVSIKRFIQKGHLDSAKSLIPECLQLFEPSSTISDSIQWEYMLSRFGDNFRKNGYPIQALQYYSDAISIANSIYEKPILRHGKLLYNIGICNAGKGFYDEAIIAFEKAGNIFKKERGENDRYVAFSYVAIANGYSEQLDYQKALTFYRKALSIYETKYDNAGNTKPRSVSISEGRIFNNLGALYYDIGQTEKAIDHYESALVIYRQHEGEEIKQSLIYTFFNLSRAYLQLEDYSKAYGYLKVVKDYREQTINYPIDLGLVYNLLSQYHTTTNEIDEAKYYSKKAIRIFEDVFGSKHPLLMDAHTHFGNVFSANISSPLPKAGG